GIVQENVYRAATLQAHQLGMFKHIKTILYLSPEQPTKNLMSWIEDSGMTLVNLGQHLLTKTQTWRPCPEEMIKEGLETILDSNTHPILIMCASGMHETGCLVGCLRKLQHWDFNSIVFEYRSFAGNKSRFVVEQFIELFDSDLVVLPKDLPSWFIPNP
ncbi:protein-tyrosine phosphatase, partial [Gorgonomyces haynaldii]